MQVLLNTLPVPDITPGFQRGNHQLFASFMRALVRIRGVSGLTIGSLPRDLTDMCTDEAVADAILSRNPDVAGLSLYVWNRDRSLAVAERLAGKGIRLVAGGPEASSLVRGNDPAGLPFDTLFTGEAENVFLEFLTRSDAHPGSAVIRSNGPVDFTEFAREFCRDADEYLTDGLAYLETERGCPFSCSYCSYAKGRNTLTSMPMELFTACVDTLFAGPVEELYLLAPTLNRVPAVFRERLRYLAKKQRERERPVKLFGEIRPELMVEGDPELMFEAGFREIELGIQTLNGRSGNSRGNRRYGAALLDRAETMMELGIRPILDFILGLPGDRPENMLSTVETLAERGLLRYSSFYRLQVLPETDLREQYEAEGWEYQNTPPYFTVANDASTEDDIAAIYRYLDKELDHGYAEELTPEVPGGVATLERPGDEDGLLTSPFLHTVSLADPRTYPAGRLKTVLSSYFRAHPEVFHRAYLMMPDRSDDPTGAETVLGLARECEDLMNGFPNGYDAYRMLKGGSVLSKKTEILLPPSADEALIRRVMSMGLDAGFYLPEEKAAEELLRRLSAYREEWGLPVYAGRELRELPS